MCGIRNFAGHTPVYIRTIKNKNTPDIKIMEFYSNGTTLENWEKKRHQLSSKFNSKVTGIREKGNNKILLYLRKDNTSDIIYWDNSYLSNNDFTLVLGETPFGEQETVNLSDIPHILIGGGTGSRKNCIVKTNSSAMPYETSNSLYSRLQAVALTIRRHGMKNASSSPMKASYLKN